MIPVDGEEWMRAFHSEGWLDVETGRILKCEKCRGTKRYWEYRITEEIEKARGRHVRTPYLDDVQFTGDCIDSEMFPKTPFCDGRYRGRGWWWNAGHATWDASRSELAKRMIGGQCL